MSAIPQSTWRPCYQLCSVCCGCPQQCHKLILLLCRGGINLVFNSRVAAVDKEQVTVVNK